MNDFMNYNFNINKIVLAIFVAAGTGDAIHKNRPSHGLAIHKGGEKLYTFSNGKKFVVKENDIVYIPKNSNYTVEAKEYGDCYAINFDFDEDITFEPFVVKAKNHIEITEYFRSARKSWQHKKNGYLMKCKAELYNIIYAIQQQCFAEYLPAKKLDLIKPAIEYIHENYTGENISIEFLSEMCNITPEYFRKIFKSFFGISPLKYINNLKIDMAKELIVSSMYSISEVARMSGFHDEAYFSREFKKATGVSPSEYKKSAQQ